MPSVSGITVVSFGKPEVIEPATARLVAVCEACGIRIVEPDEADLAVVLGGDGTILRALRQFLGTDLPVLGVNFGRVGFLATMTPEDMETGLRRVFHGERRVIELPTLDVDVDGAAGVGVNDVVCATDRIGRMVELEWAVGGESLGVQPCDGVICATSTGSTAYNLSSGGPVLVWGLDAMAVTFVSPHSLHARPLVVPRGLELTVRNVTRDGPAKVIADGQPVGDLPVGRTATVRLGEQRALLALLPEMTFFHRYSETLLTRLRIENLVLIREAELSFAGGLNAITGETGAGKTILAQAIGLLLGAKGEAAYVGPGGGEAYVEAEFDLPAGLLGEDAFEGLAELRPDDEEGVVLARRVGAEGRTRAYAWGRSAAREDVAALGERLLAMSGQFEQRRLARPAYQLAVLDSFCGDDQLRRRAEARAAWREAGAARRRYEELTRDAAAAEARLAELRALVEDTEGMEPGQEESLRDERERLRHMSELVEGTAAAAEALDPEEGEGAAGATAAAERALAPVERLAPELQKAADELRDAELRLREAASALRSFLAALEADPGRLEQVEGELDRISAARRRFRCETSEELLGRAGEARAELEALDQGLDPAEAARGALAQAEARVAALAAELHEARAAAAGPFAEAVAAELRGIGMGDGEFRAELREREQGATGGDEVAFLIRPNAGLPFAPVAETASGGELSRVALAIAAVGGGETMVFDEIDAGIGGTTAHGVADTLARLAGRAQVITITHLPQIASRADRHFRVEKIPGDPTHTRIQELSAEERKEELERMLGGREFLAALET